MSTTLPIIMCMKWGTPYSADYVNLLHRATRAYLTRPHRFVCFTDDATDFDADIETFPIPDMRLPHERITHGGWPKLSVFKPELYGLVGRALYLDLDVIITGKLDKLLDRPGMFLIIREWARLNDKLRGKAAWGGNSAVFAFDIGAQAQIYQNFMTSPEQAYRAHRIEQRFVSAHAHGLDYWPDNWCLSFKRHMMRPFPLPPQNEVPSSAAVVTFHGRPKPDEVARGGWWGKFPRCGIGKVTFVRNYWREYGLL